MSSSTDAEAPAGHGPQRMSDQQTGLRLLAGIWRRELWNLLFLNLVFIVTALPVITLGPALAAMTRVTLHMVQDRPVDVWRDYRIAFLDNFRQGLLAGFTLAAACLATGWSTLFFLLNLNHGLLMLLLLAASLSALLTVLVAGFYVFAQIAAVRLPFPTILNNAILLAFTAPGRTLPALFASAALAALPFLFPPVAPLVFLVLFSAVSLFASVAVWPGIHEHVMKNDAGSD